MTKQEFNHLVNHTHRRSTVEDTKQLEHLVTIFPYCQTGHLLLSKAVKEQGSMLSEMKIKIAAAYSVNRRHLKRFLLSEVVPYEETKPQENLDDLDTEQNTIKERPFEEADEAVKVEISSAKQLNAPAQQPEIGSNEDTPAVKLAEEINKNLEELRRFKEAEKAEESSIQVFEEEAKKTSDLSSDVVREEIETSKEAIKTSDGVNANGATVNDDQAAMRQRLEALSKQVKKEGEQRRKKIQRRRDQVYGFSRQDEVFDSRLGALSSQKENSETDLILKYLQSLDRKKTKRFAKKEEAVIIDQFIKNETDIARLVPKRAEKGDVVEDFSQKSTVKKKGVVSENMAKIYVKQGNFSKAIEIYEQLVLKKTEKKPYFVEQIEKLKNQQ